MSLVIGVDEAGRGPVLGPMVMVGLCIGASERPYLQQLGVQDSKVFGSSQKAKEQREHLALKLMDWAYHIEIARSDEIDQWVTGKGLNALERNMAEKILNSLPTGRVMLDGASIFGSLCSSTIQAENKADQRYLEVAGASIIAKHIRDQQFHNLVKPFETSYGPINGGGYPNLGTYKFVNWYVQETGDFPAFLRHSYQWKAIAHLR